jgi:hypothetical protein
MHGEFALDVSQALKQISFLEYSSNKYLFATALPTISLVGAFYQIFRHDCVILLKAAE